jgi:hypothetical protein
MGHLTAHSKMQFLYSCLNLPDVVTELLAVLLELLLLRYMSNHARSHVLLGTGHAHVSLRRGQLLDGRW